MFPPFPNEFKDGELSLVKMSMTSLAVCLNVISDKDLHPPNAEVPMTFTDLGMSTDDNGVSENA